MKNRWYDMTAEEVANAFGSDIKKGLTDADVSQRLKKYHRNNIFTQPSGACLKYMRHATVNIPSVILFLYCIICALANKTLEYAVTPLLLIFSVLLLYPAYYKSRRVLEKSENDSVPQSKVIRNGRIVYIKQDMIVPGDIIVISAGDIIPCDCRLAKCENLRVTEQYGKSILKNALFLTHEDIPPEKRINMVFSTGIVTEGSGIAISVGTGKMTLFVSEGNRVPLPDYDKIPVLGNIKRLSRIVSLSLCILVFILSLIALVADMKLDASAVFSISLAVCVAALSDLLPMLAVIIISCGVFSVEKKRKNNMPSLNFRKIEKLGDIRNVNCLIFHKSSLFPNENIVLSNVYTPFEGFRSIGSSKAEDKLIVMAIVAKQLTMGNKAQLNMSALNPENEALIKTAKSLGIYNKKIEDEYKPLFHADSQVFIGKKFDLTVTKGADGKNIVYIAGTPEAAIAHCKFERTERGTITISPKRRAELLSFCENKMAENNKITVISSKKGVREDLSVPVDTLTETVLEGMLFVKRPMLDGALEYIRECISSGIKTVMLCDDMSEKIDVKFAENLGIISSPRESVTIRELQTMSPDLIRANIPLYNLYRGLKPQQIAYIVQSLVKDSGYKVGFIGRELSDLSAMSNADVSFAEYIQRDNSSKTKKDGKLLPTTANKSAETSIGGCEAIRYVGDITISKPGSNGNGGYNSAFSSIVTARGIFANLRSMCFYNTICISSLLALLVCSIISGTVFLPVPAIVFLGCVIDLFAIISIAFEKPGSEILRKKQKKITGDKHDLTDIVLCAIAPFILTVLFVPFLGSIGINAAAATSVIFLSQILLRPALVAELSVIGSIFSSKVRMYNIYPLFLIFTLAFAVLSLIFPNFGALFGVTMPQGIALFMVLLPTLAVIIAFEVYKGVNKKRRKT